MKTRRELSDLSWPFLIRVRSTLPMKFGTPAVRTRFAAAAISLLALPAVLLAACGGGSAKAATAKTTTTTAPAGARANAAALQAFRSCLTQHGVTLPTPPTTAPGQTFAPRDQTGQDGGRGFGGGFGGGFGALGAIANNPAYQAAFNACKGTLPAGFLQRQQQRQQQFNAFISCMKDNGVTITTAQGSRGLGSIDRTSAAYQKCSVLLPNGGNFGPRNSTTTTSP